jgi:chromosome segregation ATPase
MRRGPAGARRRRLRAYTTALRAPPAPAGGTIRRVPGSSSATAAAEERVAALEDELRRSELQLAGAREALEQMAREYATASLGGGGDLQQQVRALRAEQERLLTALHEAWARAERAEGRADEAERRLGGYEASRLVGAVNRYWQVKARVRG